jgi:hypothetical protein
MNDKWCSLSVDVLLNSLKQGFSNVGKPNPTKIKQKFTQTSSVKNEVQHVFADLCHAKLCQQKPKQIYNFYTSLSKL